MALSFFTSGGSASNAKLFDIRLNDQYIVFRGSEHEAASAHLSGTLVLCLSEPLSIKHLRLRLTGMSRICWYLPATVTQNSRKQLRERVFYDKSWTFRDAGKNKTETLAAGNYEFPFDVILEGSLPESVEGLADTWITYRFKAEIGRKYAKDIVVRKPLRIIRTLDSSNLELAHLMSVENVWPNKIEYSISTPSKAVLFGTMMTVDFKLIPLLKGLRIGLITSQLVECHDFVLNPEDPESDRNTYKNTRVVLTDEYEVDPDSNLELIDDAAEGYQFSRLLDLPKSLSRCLQDVEAKGIKIRHKLKFRIQLHNPDGHISELRATLPVTVFISPQLAIGENNTLIDQSPQVAQRAAEELVHQAPPLYGEHQFDQLYREVDLSGYRTPGTGSGSGTPFGALSRNISSDNLASMDALANANISASALHSRLTSLTTASRVGHASPAGDSHDSSSDVESLHRRPGALPTDYFGTTHSSSSPHSPISPGLSRRPSDEVDPEHIASGMATPFNYAQYAELETLSRVPSYSTAVRTAHVGPCDANLPVYNAVMASDMVTPPTPQSPQPAHIRSGGHTPLTPPSSDHLEVHHLPAAASHPPSAFHAGVRTRVADDAERSLRLAQARGRA